MFIFYEQGSFCVVSNNKLCHRDAITSTLVHKSQQRNDFISAFSCHLECSSLLDTFYQFALPFKRMGYICMHVKYHYNFKRTPFYFKMDKIIGIVTDYLFSVTRSFRNHSMLIWFARNILFLSLLITVA